MLSRNSRISREGIGRARLRVREPQALVGKKEEKLIFDDRTAQHPSEVMLMDCASGQTRAIEKPVVGVEHSVAQVIEGIAMEGLRRGVAALDDLETIAALKSVM